jgi:hypothetical protein
MTTMVEISEEELFALRRLAERASSRPTASIRMVGKDEALMVLLDEEPVGIEKVVRLNKTSVVTETGKTFSRGKGRMCGNPDRLAMRAVPVEGFPYALSTAIPTCRKLSDKVSTPRAMKVGRLLTHHLSTRDHLWFDAVMIKSEWLKVINNDQICKLLTLHAEYQILTGKMKGVRRLISIPYIVKGEKVETDSGIVEKMFDAEETDFFDDDKVSPEFFIEHLGKRPVQIHCSFTGNKFGHIDDIRPVTDNWIEAVIRWEVDPESGEAWKPEA